MELNATINKKKPIITFLFSSPCNVLYNCSGGSVLMDWDMYGTFELNKYKTFDFFQFDNDYTGQPEFEKNINQLQECIVKKMEENELFRSSINPDLLLNLGIVVEVNLRTREMNLSTDPFLYVGQCFYTGNAKELPVGSYEEGSITLHLVENRSNRAVWVGTIHQAIPKKSKSTPKILEEVVDILFNEVNK